MSADPCSGNGVGGACRVFLSARDDFSVPGCEADSPTTSLRVTGYVGLLVVIT